MSFVYDIPWQVKNSLWCQIDVQYLAYYLDEEWSGFHTPWIKLENMCLEIYGKCIEGKNNSEWVSEQEGKLSECEWRRKLSMFVSW